MKKILQIFLVAVSMLCATTTFAQSKIFGTYKMSDSMFGYLNYTAKISQSATGAPSATIYINGFGAATFTWARTSAGVYTCTASTAIFTSTKTHVIIQPPSTSLVSYKAVVTSTTVVTLTTSLDAVIATLLTFVPTDALLTNTLFEVRVYD